MFVISIDIAAMHVSRSIGYITKQCAKNGRLNYVMRFYLGSLRASILVIARFAFCRLIQRTMYFCCSTLICVGCFRAEKCPFCRHPVQAYEEYDKDRANRIKVNDPVAMREMGATLYHEEDYKAATDYWYWTKAAE